MVRDQLRTVDDEAASSNERGVECLLPDWSDTGPPVSFFGASGQMVMDPGPRRHASRNPAGVAASRPVRVR